MQNNASIMLKFPVSHSHGFSCNKITGKPMMFEKTYYPALKLYNVSCFILNVFTDHGNCVHKDHGTYGCCFYNFRLLQRIFSNCTFSLNYSDIFLLRGSFPVRYDLFVIRNDILDIFYITLTSETFFLFQNHF